MAINLTKGDTALLIEEGKREGLLRNQLACALGNIYHETAGTMRPVREYGGEAYLRTKKYYPHVGMGYIQLTWEYNYKMASDKLGVDFVSDPKLLLDPQYAKVIAIRGMKEGWFTGKKLSDFVDLQHSDYFNARGIVNGDKNKKPKVKAGQTAVKIGDTVAGYCRAYDALLKAAGYGEEPTDAPQQPADVEDTPIIEQGPASGSRNTLDRIVSILRKLFGV